MSSGKEIITGGLYAIALLSAVYGFAELVHTVQLATTAPQQAAGAALAVGWAVIPYCGARCIDLAFRGDPKPIIIYRETQEEKLPKT